MLRDACEATTNHSTHEVHTMELLLESALLIGFFILNPLYGWWSFPRWQRALAEGRTSRFSVYKEVLITQWTATAGLALLWWMAGRNVGALGLGFEDTSGAWLAVIVAVLGTAAMAVQVLAVRSSASLRQQVLSQLESVVSMTPHTRRELGWFAAVSVTAGICEELLYRGFLFWWLGAEMGLGTVGAAVISTVAFGLAHAYQGWGGVFKTGIIGGAMMGLRLLAGSIWPGVVLHAVVDLLGGYAAYSALTLGGDDDHEAAVPSGEGRLAGV